MNAQDQQRFDEIRHRLERVTPGPWTVMYASQIVAMAGTPEETVVALTSRAGADPDFLAHSLDDITWLTERVRDLERAAKGRG